MHSDRVLVIGVATGKIKATNKPFEDRWVLAITVRGGKLATIREYIDTQAMTRAARTDASGPDSEALRLGLGTSLCDTVTRQIRQDGACDDVGEMIGPPRECRQVDKPTERRHQSEQVVPVHIGARLPGGLSAKQQALAR